MQKIIITFLLCLIFTQSFSQTQRKVSTYMLIQYNNTIKDITLGNNPWGMGVGIQAFLNNKTKFKPTIEVTADAYLADDKVGRSTSDGKIIDDVGGMTNVFLGSSFHPTQNIYLSIVAGPSFISDHTFFGVKPSVGFYFFKNQRIIGKLSYINIFNRNKMTKEDFTSISLSFGVKLF